MREGAEAMNTADFRRIATLAQESVPYEALSMWTIYDRPTDYPCFFVARLSYVGPSGVPFTTPTVLVANGLDELREMLPEGLTCIDRSIDDPAQIVEVWL